MKRSILRSFTQIRQSSSACPPPLPSSLPAAPISRANLSDSIRISQPLPSTHPHLFNETSELTPGIKAQEYEERRRKLMSNLEIGSIVIVAGGKIKYMSANIFYKFRQATNFWYLTGWEEPDSVLLLEKDSSLRGYKMTMFCPSKDANDEVWNGPRNGSEGALAFFGADEAADISLLSSRLKAVLTKPSASTSEPIIYADVTGVSPSTRFRLARQKLKSKSLFDYLVPSSTDYEEVCSILNGEKSRVVRSASREIEKMRIIKSDAEVRVMRKAADISSRAHVETMKFATSSTSLTESSLVAHFEYMTSLAGSPRQAYVPVCSAGESALTIHYTANNLPFKQQDLLLLDAGCEFGGYSSDITRTWPISGKFTSAQSDLYEAVLSVEKECIKLCKGSLGISLDELHSKSCSLMKEELIRLGFNLRGGEMERILYPHFLSHPLGIDLHDTASFSRGDKLTAGMVITIEPGLYVPPHDSFPNAFHNLAIRVEDEVLIREDDYVILSVDAPKEVCDIEFAMQR